MIAERSQCDCPVTLLASLSSLKGWSSPSSGISSTATVMQSSRTLHTQRHTLEGASSQAHARLGDNHCCEQAGGPSGEPADEACL